MSDLRSRLVRLAHADPALRPHLIPILASTARHASGGRITLDVTTDATNLTDLGGGKWAVDGTCTVNAPGMPATSFRFDRFALAHSETSGWTAAVAANRQDPLKLALVAAGLEGVVPPSAAESTTKPRLEFEVNWGGGNVVELAMVIGSRGDKLPKESPAHVYAARQFVAEIGKVADLKQVLVKSLGLPGVRSVEGPKRPTLRDVFVGGVDTGDDRRRVYVRYKIYNKNLLDTLSTWKEDLRRDLRRAGVRY